jgi:hypothetical protein
VCSRTKKGKQHSRVSKRLLDPAPWKVVSYKKATGDCILVRNSDASRRALDFSTSPGEDKEILAKAAKKLLQELKARPEFQADFEKNTSVKHEPGVNGWYTILGKLRREKIFFGIALDDFTCQPEKRFWVGFTHSSSTMMRRMKKACPSGWKKLEGRRIISCLLVVAGMIGWTT